MTTGQWVWLAVAAIAVFWMVGGYNRVVALRSQIGAAATQLEGGMQRRVSAIDPLLSTLRTPLAGEQGALDALLAALLAAQAAAAALRGKPASSEGATTFARADGAWAAALSRVRSLVEQQPALAGDASVAPHLHALADAEARVAFARQLFNEAAGAYDAAVQQFPTSLLAWLFGLERSGRL